MNLEKDYKELHKIPEIGFKEFKTKEYILNRLKKLNVKIFEVGETGIIAYFDYRSDKTIAFRAELDGLNIKEENDVEYKSTHDNFMHACGHDAHMSIALSLCDYLNEHICPNNVCVIFQPSEEIYGGALEVVNNNFFKQLCIKEIYALHLWPCLKEGVIYSKSGSLLASSTEIDIKIIGKSAHIANYSSGIDSIKVANELLSKLSNSNDIIFNCGNIITKGSRNTICSEVLLECSLRSFSVTKKYFFLEMLNRIAKEMVKKHSVDIHINSEKSLPILSNDYGLFIKHNNLINEITEPFYQAEDFSVYSNNAKTMFFLLGIGESECLHSSKFNFNIDVLKKGLDLFESIANQK